jgi:hypothetical protein
MWFFASVPSDYTGIIWSIGYSIENDLYEHSDLENLLDDHEATEHQALLSCLCRWFAFEVEEYLAGRECQVGTHVNRILSREKLDVDPSYAESRGMRLADIALVSRIQMDYRLAVRGKQLFQLLLVFISARKRKSKFSTENLYELCVKKQGHPNTGRLLSELKARLA